MSATITGVVTNGVVVPSSPLPEGEQVEIQLELARTMVPAVPTGRPSPAELRRMPRDQRRAILAAAAAIAEQDYHADKDLTDFAAFGEEERDEVNSDSR